MEQGPQVSKEDLRKLRNEAIAAYSKYIYSHIENPNGDFTQYQIATDAAFKLGLSMPVNAFAPFPSQTSLAETFAFGRKTLIERLNSTRNSKTVTEAR